MPAPREEFMVGGRA